MGDDELRYDQMVENALRGVVRAALIHAAEKGLPGDHHFYITFRTDAPDVDIPDSLRETYPTEMTIVLQHQFWDLSVEDDHFNVTLSFSNVPSRLTVPYESVIAFADPSVRFGLQFDLEEGAEDVLEAADNNSAEPGGDNDAEAGGSPPEEIGSAKVITLDTFRKK